MARHCRVMNERAQLAWLARRVGFGLAPGQLDAWEAKGVDTVLDELTDPDGHSVATVDDPFAALTREIVQGQNSTRDAITAWVRTIIDGQRPLESWMQFFWHDFFAVSARVVRIPGLMFDHFRLLRAHALGNFGEFLRQMTTDGAMLVFLDGTSSTAAAPNENYARELMELYSVGVGQFTEADVQAAARALTGWVVMRRRDDEVFHVPRRHDDRPQILLGVQGVHDVDSVIAAVIGHPATALRLTRLLAAKILGSSVDPVVIERHATLFWDSFELRPLVRGLLEDGLDGAGTDVIIEPFPWFVSAVRAVQAPPRGPVVATSLRSAGQIPFLPPNVGGFPPPLSYLSTSATVARFNLASAIAQAASRPTPALAAAQVGDIAALADALGLVAGFSASTAAAISTLDAPADRLAAALAAPDLIVA